VTQQVEFGLLNAIERLRACVRAEGSHFEHVL